MAREVPDAGELARSMLMFYGPHDDHGEHGDSPTTTGPTPVTRGNRCFRSTRNATRRFVLRPNGIPTATCIRV